MGQKHILALLVVLTLGMLGFAVYTKTDIGRKLPGVRKQFENWKWTDQWDGKSPLRPVPPPSAPTPPILVSTYAEALKKSGEMGRPVLVVFTAEWCSFCKKMKETLASLEVQAALGHYIFVTVDTDQDRTAVRKFGVEQLPTCIITNVEEKQLKVVIGYQSPTTFSAWLNDPALRDQPKKPAGPAVPPPPPEKKPDDNRKPRRPGPSRPGPSQPPDNPGTPPGS